MTTDRPRPGRAPPRRCPAPPGSYLRVIGLASLAGVRRFVAGLPFGWARPVVLETTGVVPDPHGPAERGAPMDPTPLDAGPGS